MSAATKVTGVAEVLAVCSSTPFYIQTGSRTMDDPMPNKPTIKPPKKPDIIQFHIFFELILSLSL